MNSTMCGKQLKKEKKPLALRRMPGTGRGKVRVGYKEGGDAEGDQP